MQWLNNPVHAVKEFRRVTRPGGKLVCCNFDGFSVPHFPIDEAFQSDVNRVFNELVDPYAGRKMFSMFHSSGLTDIKVDFEPDATFTVAGAIDGERRRNWIDQFGAAHKAIAECLGFNEAAKSFVYRILDHYDREDTFTTRSLYCGEGVVP